MRLASCSPHSKKSQMPPTLSASPLTPALSRRAASTSSFLGHRLQRLVLVVELLAIEELAYLVRGRILPHGALSCSLDRHSPPADPASIRASGGLPADTAWRTAHEPSIGPPQRPLGRAPPLRADQARDQHAHHGLATVPTMKWIGVAVLAVIGIIAAFVAIEYLVVPIHSLPQLLPWPQEHQRPLPQARCDRSARGARRIRGSSSPRRAHHPSRRRARQHRYGRRRSAAARRRLPARSMTCSALRLRPQRRPRPRSDEGDAPRT